MKRFVVGEDRSQGTLFPERLDDFITEDNPVQIVEYFIESLPLDKLGFTGVEPKDTGRPAYHPSVLLKIYVYGYLNRIQSSRRLEREAQRNVELMWLTGRLTPDFKTIADFRKNNGKAIQDVCRRFVLLCREWGLFADTTVAIDGSKFKAANNRDRNFTSAKMKRRLAEIDKSIHRYLSQIETADRLEPSIAEPKTGRLKDKIEALKQEMERLKKIEAAMLEAPDQQLSLTDPDARSMKSRGSGIVGYNVQTAVDAEHHLIVAHEVTNTGSDRGQLSKIAKLARTALQVDDLTVVADRGYYEGEEIVACETDRITTFIPKPLSSQSTAAGRFGKPDFIYVASDDEYQCPDGQRLVWHMATIERGKTLHSYWNTAACSTCTIKAQCTTGKERRLKRWEHEDVLDAMQLRLDHDPEKMRLRRNTVEHPFGTLKVWMGYTHFQMMTLDKVSTEMSLHVLAYNMKRVINLFGVEALIKKIRAYIRVFLLTYAGLIRDMRSYKAFFGILVGHFIEYHHPTHTISG
jgi:transposase